MVEDVATRLLEDARSQLQRWNDEADRFRIAAIAARRGKAPSSMTMNAAEQTQHGLIMLMARIDRALDRLPAGHGAFHGLLMVQSAASALLESVDASLDEMDHYVAILAPEPTRIEHRLAMAAE